MRGADRVAEAGGSPPAQLEMLGDELLDVIHRYPDHVWVFLHEFPALTGERAATFRERRQRVRAPGRGGAAGRRRVGRVPRPRPVAHGPGVARHAQLHLPVVAAGRAPDGARRGQAVRRDLHPRHPGADPLTAPSSRRRRPAPSRSSSGSRRWRGTSRRPRGRSAGAEPERVAAGDGVERLGRQLVVDRRAERARAHAVHPDAVAGVLDRRHLGELDHRRLRRAVRARRATTP